MKKRNKNLRGSILVFTLLVITILLAATMSAALVVIIDKNSSRTTEKSVLSFQIADGAVENILKRVYQDNDNSLQELANRLYGSAECQAGVIRGVLPTGTGSYEVILLDNNGARLQCNGAGYNSYALWRPQLVRLISTGTYAGTTRSIDVGVRP